MCCLPFSFFLSVCLFAFILFVLGPLFHPSSLIIHLAKQYLFFLVGRDGTKNLLQLNFIPTSANVDKNMFLNVLHFLDV